MNRSFARVSTFIIHIKLNERIDGLLDEQRPNLVFPNFQTFQHLISDDAEIIPGKVIINERKIRSHGRFDLFPLKRSGDFVSFQQLFTIGSFLLTKRAEKLCLQSFSEFVSRFWLCFPVLKKVISRVVNLRTIRNIMVRIFPIGAERFCERITDIQVMRILAVRFITEISVDEIIIVRVSVTPIPTRFSTGIEQS